jgi:hypothetical protein
MFKKPKRNFRLRPVKFESDDENEEEMDTEETAPRIQIKQEPNVNKPVKEKKKKEKSKSVLSFDHDEGKMILQLVCVPFMIVCCITFKMILK